MKSIWRKDALIIAAVVVTVQCLLISSGFSQKVFEKSLAERRQTVLEYFVENESTPSFAAVIARYAANERLAEAHQMFSQLLRQPSSEPAYGFNLMATYLFGRRHVPDSLREKVQRIFSTNAFLCGAGENDQLRYYVALLLAAQTWPDMTAQQWFNGKSSTENWREACDYLAHWMESTVTDGQTEFDSPELLPSFIASLELLHEFVNDEHTPSGTSDKSKTLNLHARAAMMLDLLLIDFALEHIDGMYAGGHSYDPEPGVFSPRQSANAALSWLYFGAGEMKPTVEALLGALSSYTMPGIIYDLATNRDPLGGYVHRERKLVRNLLRNRHERNQAVYKYAYITRDYILSSVQGGLLYPLQQHTWDLTYFSPKDQHPTLFVMHPYHDPRELGTFFVDEPALLLDELIKFKSRYHQGDKLSGGSPYEQIFQHRNVLIALYNIPEKVRFGHIAGFFSEGLQDWEGLYSDGLPHEPAWIFCRAGNTFVALRPLQSFQFTRMEGGLHYISQGRHNGIILEVSTPEESKTFEEFKRRIRGVSNVEFKAENQQVKVKYTTVYGDRMEFLYDGSTNSAERYLNEFPHRYTAWPLFENPFIKYDENKRRLQVRVKNKWRALDFMNWTVSERAGSFTEELEKW
ncbi:MAG: hypothetical protein ONB44_20680 [candidate division KSB1 bacterium]|nr:hypothetical protein [candidate division KSB1 bacterium]MDZ7304548.1 hypothetical protein [candidate division KSB1 bacterium]MDZ7313717.1 hypothetical protein [candidate division KSB1 bacterium]